MLRCTRTRSAVPNPLKLAAAMSASAQPPVHSVAVAGFGEGTNDHYDRARPSYPPEALHHIAANITTPPGGATIIEPGSGTGIFSRLLLAPPAGYPSFNLKELVAVEPSAGMRGAWDRANARLPADLASKGRTVEGGFDDLTRTGLPPASADAVIIAQAWHWCPDHEAALHAIAESLKPGAPLVLIWNLESDGDAWHARLRATYQPKDRGSPQYYRGLWKKMFDTAAYKELFDGASDAHFPWEVGMTEDAVVGRLFSKSYLTEAHLQSAEREAFEKELRAAIRSPGREWIDEKAGIFKYKYVTDVWVIRKKNA